MNEEVKLTKGIIPEGEGCNLVPAAVTCGEPRTSPKDRAAFLPAVLAPAGPSQLPPAAPLEGVPLFSPSSPAARLLIHGCVGRGVPAQEAPLQAQLLGSGLTGKFLLVL